LLTEGKMVMQVYLRNELTMNYGWSEIEPRVSNCKWTGLCKHIYDIFKWWPSHVKAVLVW